MAETNLYETLGVAKDASPDEIRRAYKKRALQTHPDKLGPNITQKEREAAEEQFRKVNHAYEVLNDTENRKIYDLYGRWPPPDAVPEPRPSAGNRQADPFNTFNTRFHDPFFDFPDPFRGTRRHFAFTDPFELFNSIFGDLHRGPLGGSLFDDPFFDDFPSPFGGARRNRDPFDSFGRGSLMSPFGGLLGGSMFSPFQQIMDSPNANVRSASYSAIGYDNGQERRWVSQSRMTRTINGVTESVWKRTDSDGNEHVTLTYPDGRQRYTINGVEQPSPQDNRYLQGAPQESRADRYLPSSTQRNVEGPVVPPPFSANNAYQPEPKRPRPEYAYEKEPRRSSSVHSSHSNAPSRHSHHSHHSHHSQTPYYPASRPRGGYPESHRDSMPDAVGPHEPVIPDQRYSMPIQDQPPLSHYATPPPTNNYAPPPSQAQYNQAPPPSNYYNRPREPVRDHHDESSQHKRHWWKW